MQEARYSQRSQTAPTFFLVVPVLALFFAVASFAYEYDQNAQRQREIAFRKVKALNPYEGQPINALKQRKYAEGWYKSIGEGMVTVFLWVAL